MSCAIRPGGFRSGGRPGQPAHREHPAQAVEHGVARGVALVRPAGTERRGDMMTSPGTCPGRRTPVEDRAPAPPRRERCRSRYRLRAAGRPPPLAVGRPQVGHDRALVRVAQRTEARWRRRPAAAPSGAAFRRLDEQHVGTEVGEDPPGDLAAVVTGVDDLHPSQRSTAACGHVSAGRNFGSASSSLIRSNVTTSGRPTRSSSSGTPTMLVIMRTPSSRSTIATL